MTDLLATGAAFLRDAVNAHMTRTVTYHRGAAALSLQAASGSTTFTVETSAGIMETLVSADFIFKASLLDLGAGITTPQRGDYIIMDALRFEVLALAGEPNYRYSDPYQHLMRVHCKQGKPT